MNRKRSSSNGNGVIAAERRRLILHHVLVNGAVNVSDLADAYHVGLETIRRDLDKLDREGKLIRSHGGAIAKASGVIIIAEGIEKKAEKEKLLKLGVDCLQGYLISRPLSFNDIRLWLADHASRRPFGKRTNISGET